MTRSVWAARAVTPDGERSGVRLHVADGRIVRLEPAARPAPGDDAFESATLLPGLIDLQVNGGAGAAYDEPDPEAWQRATRHHLERGTTSLLATLVTGPLDGLRDALARLAPLVEPGGPLLGLHLEGPFLCEAKAGAHAREWLCDPSAGAAEALLAQAAGTLRMVTLAPELPGAEDAIARFSAAGAVVAAGHTQASHQTLLRAIEAGLSFVTHLGNATDWPDRPFDEALGYRRSEPGVIGTFLFEPRLRGSLILDGLHLHPGLARALVQLRGPDALVLVSDATAAAGLPPGRQRLGALEIEVREGYATLGGGLAGSVITLLDALRVAVEQSGLTLATALRMASATPARVLGCESRKGALAPGCDADLLLLGEDWQPHAVYQRGVRV